MWKLFDAATSFPNPVEGLANQAKLAAEKNKTFTDNVNKKIWNTDLFQKAQQALQVPQVPQVPQELQAYQAMIKQHQDLENGGVWNPGWSINQHINIRSIQVGGDGASATFNSLWSN